MDILDTIMEYKRHEVEESKKACSLQVLRERISREGLIGSPSMKASLMENGFGIIAEFKRRSPSKDWINQAAQPSIVPMEYQRNGAAALSILTDGHFFAGDDGFVAKARMSGVTLPILYKNFVIDEYQLYQARLCGASAVLLIAACLTMEECGKLIATARLLEMEVLLEIHSEKELPYIALAPDMVGVNNRNLGTFHTDVENSFRLVDKLPHDICKVSESGISSPSAVASLIEVGYEGFLIGENFMRDEHPGRKLAQFVEEVKMNVKTNN